MRWERFARTGVAVLAITAALSERAAGQATNWQGPTLTWNTAGSWSAGIPTATSTANFTGVATGTITLGTATTGVLNTTGGPYVLNAGTLTISGAGSNLTTSGAANMEINGRLVASGLTAVLSGGTLTLSNTQAGANANSLTGAITVNASATLTAVVAGTVGTGNFGNTTSTSVGSNSLGSASVTLSGGILNLQGALVSGGATGQFFDQNSGATATSLINANGQLAFGNGRSDYFVRSRFNEVPNTGNVTGTTDRSRANAFLNVSVPKTLGGATAIGALPSGTTAVNVGQISALTPPADPTNADFSGGLSFYNDGNGRAFGQPTATIPAPFSTTTNYINVGQYAGTNHLARFSGYFKVENGGQYTFDTQSDDASLVYIDGKLVVYNNNDQGVAATLQGRFGPTDYTQNPAVVDPINLAAGSTHLIEVLYQQGGGGAGLLVNYTGPDSGVIFGTNTAGPISARAFTSSGGIQAGGFQAQVGLGNNVTLTANSTINATQAFEMRLGTLTFNPGLTLTTGTSTSVGNALVRFVGGTTLSGSAGTYTFTALGSNDVAPGTLTVGTGANTIVKTGPNNLILDGSTPTIGGTLTYDIRGGRVVAVSNVIAGTPNVFPNPLGVGAIINLNQTGTPAVTETPASLMIRPENPASLTGTTLGGVTGNPTTGLDFANRVNVINDGVLEIAPFLHPTDGTRSLTNIRLLGVGTPAVAIDVAASKTLTMDIYNGMGNFNVVGNITGTATSTILKGAYPYTTANPTEIPASGAAAAAGSTQPATPPIYNGDGLMTLSGDNTAYNGLFVINRGTVNFASATSLFGATSIIRISGGVTYNANDNSVPPATINGNAQGGGTLGFSAGATYTSTPQIVVDGGTINNASGTNVYPGSIAFGFTPLSRVYNAINAGANPLVPVTTAAINVGTGALTLSGNIDYGNAVRTVNKTGANSLTLSGSALNLVSGTTISVQAGTLVSNNANVFGTIGSADVQPGATFNVGVSQTIGGLSGTGTTQLNANVLTIGSTNNLSANYPGVIAGTGGSIIKAGTGTLALSGNSTYTGGTRVNAGTLSVGTTTAIGTGPLTLAGGNVRIATATTSLTPLATTGGFNQDVFASVNDLNGIANGASYGGTNAVDGNSGATNGNYLFYERGRNTTNPGFGLPVGGTIISQLNPNITFQLQPYGNNSVSAAGNVNNSMNFQSNGQQQTVTLNTPQALVAISILHNSGSGAATYTARLNFTDASFTDYPGLASPDWFGGANPAFGGGVNGVTLDRLNRSNGNYDNNTTNPRFYQQDLVLNPADTVKQVASITFTRNTGGVLNIYAISTGGYATNPQTFANNVVVVGNTTSGMAVLNTPLTFGTLTFQTGTTTALNITPDGAIAANAPYSVIFGATTLAGTSSLSVANNGTGTGSVTLGAITDGGTAATLTKAGTGTLILNTASGVTSNGTVINLTTGAINSGASTALGNATVNQSAGTTLNVNVTQSVGMLTGAGGTTNLNGNTLTVGGNNTSGIYAGVIANGTGTGSLTKVGTGTLYLNGTNTYTGLTTVSGGTFGGRGSLAGGLTMASGTTLSPGNSPGILTINGAVTLVAGSNVSLELNGTSPGNTATSHDQINLGSTGSINLGNSTLLLSITGPSDPAFNNATLTVITGTGVNAVTGIFNNLPNGSPVVFANPFGSGSNGFYGGTILYNPSSVVISGIVPVPEPAHVLLLCGGVAGAIRWYRRRRTV
ncbi:MAG: PA14 domain-containing protein [Gemmataceae bacterium]